MTDITERPTALIFASEGRNIVIDSPVKVQILIMMLNGETKFDVIVNRLGKAKSTVSVHLHDLVTQGVISEKQDDVDGRKKHVEINAEYLGTIKARGMAGTPSVPAEAKQPAMQTENQGYPSLTLSGTSIVFRTIFNSIRTSLIKTGIYIEPVLYNAGVTTADELSDILCGKQFDDFIAGISEFFSTNGLGKVSLISTDPISIQVENCYECQNLPKINKPACHFDAGLLSRLFTIQMNKEYEAIETHCYAAGDPYCRFIIREKTTPVTATAASIYKRNLSYT